MDNYQVFIISQGRDGSTLLLRILNEIPGYNIYGENFNMIGSMMDIHIGLNTITGMISRSDYDKKSIENPKYKPSWYNSYNKDDVNKNIKGFLESIINDCDARVWGCKEIRWAVDYQDKKTLIPYKQFHKRLDHLKSLYPNCKFIFTERDLESQLKSGWWQTTENARDIISKLKKYYQRYMKTSDNSYMVSYNDIINCNNNFKDLFKFLGEEFNQRSYNKIINKNPG